MRHLATAFLLLGLSAAPGVAAPIESCPIAGDSKLIMRLAWVDAAKTMRSGAVVVDGKHLAGEQASDGAAVLTAYRLLATKYRVGAVVNLRGESNEDAGAAKAAGMAFLHLPIEDGRAPTPDQVVTFFDFLSLQRHHHVVTLWHCAGGIGRTGVLAGMLRLQEGWSTRAAAHEMFRMGLTYDQAVEDLPALNAFATALGKPGFYPADWRGPRQAPYAYAAIARKLPRVN